MIEFSQAEIEQLSEKCVDSFWAHCYDKRSVEIPLEKYPDFILLVDGYEDPDYPDDSWLCAHVRLNRNGTLYTVGAISFDEQHITPSLIREGIEKALNSFVDFYNAVENGSHPSDWPGFSKNMHAKIAFAESQTILREYIQKQNQPTHTQTINKPLRPERYVSNRFSER